MMLLRLVVLLTVCFTTTNAATSREAKCLMDCYKKCLDSGLLNATTCNCDVINDRKLCSTSLDESIIRNGMINDIVPVKTEYLESRRIRIQLNDNSINAFVYIFEYSTVTTAPDNWIFAGANTLPNINFTIDDACRDYQFRVIVILRNEDDQYHWFIVYRPRAIPVDLPTFAITADKIHTTTPVYNADDDTIVVYISWENPTGYTDADIYGYEGPAIYPVQCNSPEAELQSPSVELKKGGGRLRIGLPSEVLQHKCRVWAEVQMLPRCIRLEPFSIQQSFELNCDKLMTLEVCKHEVIPQCTNVIDVWGRGTNATITWVPEDNFGAPLYYHIRYGPAQMQGVPPLASWTIALLHELKVTGNSTSVQLHVDPDIDYGIQICGVYDERWKNPKFELIRVTPFTCTSCKTMPMESFGRCGECAKIEGPLLERRCHPKGRISCTSAGSNANSSNIKDNELLNSLTVLPSDVFIDSPPSHSAKTNARSKPLHSSHVRKDFNTTISQPAMKSSTNLVLPLEERGIELVALDAQSTGELANAPLKKSFANQDRTKQAIMPNNAVEITSATSNSGNGIQLPTFVEHSPTTTSNEGRLQSDRTLCTLSNGVVCEFDCIDENRCSCPDGTHTVMDNGACLSRPDNHGPSFVCFSTDDLQVTWNRWMHTLKIRSRMIYNEIKMHTNYDRIFLEFGHVNSNEQISFFDEQTEKSNKVVIRINKILQNGLFLTVPYSFYTNQTIDPLTYQYGLRICAFNNSEIKNPFMVNWTKSAGRSIIYLSGTQFERSYVENTMFTERKQMIRMAFIIVPIILIVLLMFLLVIVIYMNCTRLKRFYSRRKTRNFRPFVWNGNVPPSITSGTVYEKHPSVITKSTF